MAINVRWEGRGRSSLVLAVRFIPGKMYLCRRVRWHTLVCAENHVRVIAFIAPHSKTLHTNIVAAQHTQRARSVMFLLVMGIIEKYNRDILIVKITIRLYYNRMIPRLF